MLHGNELSESLLKEVKALVPEEISPITDIRSSKEYRTLMIKVMVERGLQAAVSALRGERSEHGAILDIKGACI
jgi:CO/xanthine dehydrogenase FAD-binding subunit